ncbi:hypothetical protein JTE90_017058 [Oedothorax gibbosus]|uniref:Uncharacterized protein n=1 Tax=Oedothorax gibbosus TaxID=931172 RepID=A0AAV6ULJ8_9ARAC|nr:hypothetical protein JTE90_017058 [Oedothorax gibbosus]
MVEVTKFNLNEVFPAIENAIKGSSFIAIDAEFTGLDLDSTNNGRLFDTMEERYRKLRNRAMSFIPCQIGISTFTKSETENSYFVETYVFFIRPYMVGSVDKRFVCQASSLDFLSKFDFDFNKFINEGIPYINEDEEKTVLKEIEDGTIGYLHEKVGELGAKRKQDLLINKKFNRKLEKSAIKEDLPEVKGFDNKLLLPKDKIFHEYFQLAEIRRKYPSLWAYSEGDMIVVEMVQSEKRKELLENSKNEKDGLIDFYLGFTKVFRLLKSSKKPIVGHNLLMDLLLFYQNFHKPLPENFSEFKKELHSVFPNVFDTRYIWLNIKKFSNLKDIPKGSSLFDLFETFKNPTDNISTLYSPNIEHTNCDKYVKEDFPHESGYDSYVTGWVFLRICHLIAMKKVTDSIFIQPQSFKQHLNAILPFVNKLNIGRSRIRYINLAGDDPLPVCEFLYLSHRTSKSNLNLPELSRLFDKYPMVELKPARNKKGAVLAIGNMRSFDDILKDFKDDPVFIVTKYSNWRHSQLVSNALWLSTLGAGCIVSFFIWKYASR